VYPLAWGELFDVWVSSDCLMTTDYGRNMES